MPGPAPTPTHLKLLRGNPGKRALPVNEPQPQIAETCPEPPPFVTGLAADQWWSVAPELHRLGLLSVLDVACLAAFCQAYTRFVVAEEKIARMSAHDPVMDGLLVRTADGAAKRNPLIKVAQDAAKDMLTAGSQFGMTPSARVRLGSGCYTQPLPGKFDGLLR